MTGKDCDSFDRDMKRPMTESSSSSGGSRGAEPRSCWPNKIVYPALLSIVLVTASAYVVAVVPGHFVAVAAVVAGAAPPTTLIAILPIVRRICAAATYAAYAAVADTAGGGSV